MRRRIRIAYLVDTWVWMEYWKHPESEAKKFVEGDGDLVISAITIAEVAQHYADDGETMVEARIDDMLRRCTVIPVDRKIAKAAGLLRHREIRGGIADAIILATARLGGHTIVSGDLHFRGLLDVLFLKPE
jgi:predicted nucleic acid-binding protein